MLNKLVIVLFYNLIIIVFIPSIITFFSNNYNTFNTISNNIYDLINNVDYELIDDNPQEYQINNLDQYIIGVLAAEMPATFEEEALKAQAVASRTYAYRRINSIYDEIDYTKIGQAYNSLEDMKQKWGDNFQEYYDKIKSAVYSTSGIIITYNDEPIEAVFHSTSAGITESAQNVWGTDLPYIQSVESFLDENAPNFISTVTISNNEFIEKICSKLGDIDKNDILSTFSIKSTSDAGYVLEVQVCGRTISGSEIRTLFNLRSTNFTISKNSDSITFTTKGYGHGAGLSQYGANFMALDGSDYIKILEHYYSGINLSKVY